VLIDSQQKVSLINPSINENLLLSSISLHFHGFIFK
jgi:hypothetical protein